MFDLIFLLLITSLLECQAVTEPQPFQIWKGYKLMYGTQLRNIILTNLSFISCARYCTELCQSATLSLTLNQCVTFKDNVYDSSISRTIDPQWDIIYRKEPVQLGNWTLVFRAQRDINQSLYDVWTSTGTSDDNPLSVDFPVECLQLTYSNTCTRHFRSYILDQWTNIDKVKFSLYANGDEVRYILFDGSATTWTSWFDLSNIIDTTWGNFMNPVNSSHHMTHFSIEGYDNGESKRRFSIASFGSGCDVDSVYVVAIDKTTDTCKPAWQMNLNSFPKFVYSPNDSMVILKSLLPLPEVYRFADIMAIFVTFKSP